MGACYPDEFCSRDGAVGSCGCRFMRRLYYGENPLELFPLHFLNSYDPGLELSREIATIVMIVTIALLAERQNWTRSFAAFVFVFGVWDLFYYVWLKVLMDWLRTWLEWDVLFLIPVIWLGPWICPALIALLFIVWGGWVSGSRDQMKLTPRGFATFNQLRIDIKPFGFDDVLTGCHRAAKKLRNARNMRENSGD